MAGKMDVLKVRSLTVSMVLKKERLMESKRDDSTVVLLVAY